VISLVFHGGVLPVLLIIVTGYSSIILVFFSNVRYSAEETAEIDRKTMQLTLSANRLFQYARNEKAKGG
jgi:hypothetical protein